MATVDSRREQMFPKLATREIHRLRRFFVTGDVAQGSSRRSGHMTSDRTRAFAPARAFLDRDLCVLIRSNHAGRTDSWLELIDGS